MAQEGNGPSIINNLDTDAQNENVIEEVNNEEKQSEDNESCEADHVDPGAQCETRPNGSQDSDLNDNGQNAVEMQSTTLAPSGDASGLEETNDFGNGELPSSVGKMSISSNTVTQCQSPLEPSAFVPNAAIKPLDSSGDAQENMGVSSIRQSQPLQPDHNGSEIKVKQDESSYSRQVVPGPTGAGDASRSEGPTVLPFKVRDASKESGERDADEAYNRFFSEYHPEYKCRVYRVPPLFVGKNPFVGLKKRNNLLSRSSQNYEVYGPTASDVSGDMAEKNAADCVEHLLNDWINKHEKSPAFIITSFKFVNFCNKTLEPPAADENKYVTEETNGNKSTFQKPKCGEHDLLIVHYKFGVFFIQVKSCEDTVDPNQAVRYAIDTQLEKDVDFFKANFQDLNLGVSINTAIALPNMQRAKLEEKYTHCLKRIQTKYGPDGSDRCLFRDDLPLKDDIEDTLKKRKENMLKWWRNITRNCTGFKCFDDYKLVVARYVGFKSTVEIPSSPNAVTQEGRSPSCCVSEIGNRYTKIMLTPQQVYVLNTDLTRLIIRGHYGTGKTVLLILKVRDLIKQGKKVCVISMSCSPLIHVLEASVKYDIDPMYYGNVIFHTVHDKSSLTKVLKECDAKKRHVFIDEFPSFFPSFRDKCLGKTILDYPPTLMFWCIMSREREEQMSRGPSDIFSSNQMFEEVVMERILRCPPAVQSFVPKTSRKQERKIFGYPKGKLQSDTTRGKMTDHFHSLGLPTDKTNCQPSGKIKWSDVVVIAPEMEARPFYKMFLLTLKIPLFRVSNMIPVCPTDVHRLLSGLSNKAAYTGSLESFHFAQPVATIQGTTCKIWFKDRKGRQVVELKKFSDVAQFLHENNFRNETISSMCGEDVKPFVPPNWGDVIFVDGGEVMKPESYIFLECLGVPVVTPSSVNGIITENAVLFTSRNNLEGFQRRESITFDENRVTANMEVTSCVDGPETLYVNHENHKGSFLGCDLCTIWFKDILHKLGLISDNSVSRQTTQGTVSEEKNCSIPATETSGNSLNLLEHPRNDLSFSDMVIIDERQNPKSAVEFFQRCGFPVLDKLDSDKLDDEDAFGSDTKVLYIKPPLFKGLEKKVVVVIKSPIPRVVSTIKQQETEDSIELITEDSIELAITRCASQLIVILTK